jgi:hypothetical protein
VVLGGISTQNIDKTQVLMVALLGSIWTPINPYKILNYARKSPICIKYRWFWSFRGRNFGRL